jgi:hypothetical protein
MVEEKARTRFSSFQEQKRVDRNAYLAGKYQDAPGPHDTLRAAEEKVREGIHAAVYALQGDQTGLVGMVAQAEALWTNLRDAFIYASARLAGFRQCSDEEIIRILQAYRRADDTAPKRWLVPYSEADIDAAIQGTKVH